uniref:Uncharacterized protein n=1 Tax=Arion vulgaris TaxID=1028688 RepID=A0A0B7BWF4_9EUPU
MNRQAQIGETELSPCGLNPETVKHILEKYQLYREDIDKNMKTYTHFLLSYFGKKQIFTHYLQFLVY